MEYNTTDGRRPRPNPGSKPGSCPNPGSGSKSRPGQGLGPRRRPSSRRKSR